MEFLSALSMPILLPMRSSFRQKNNTHGFLKSILYKFQDRVESYNNVLGSHLYSTEETELILYHEYEHLVKTFENNLLSVMFFGLETSTSDWTQKPWSLKKLTWWFPKMSLGSCCPLTSWQGLEKVGKLSVNSMRLCQHSPLPTSTKLELQFMSRFQLFVKGCCLTKSFSSKRLPSWTDRILYKANVANYENYKLSLNQHRWDKNIFFWSF